MLNFKRIEIQNFCNIRNTSLDLNHKVILLQGKSGQGKSAVFDACALCISSNKRANKYSEYIRQGTKQAHIYLEGSYLDKPIDFDLTIEEKTTKFTINYEKQQYKNSEAEDFLKEKEFDYYANIMFNFQNEQDITQLTPAERSTYIKKLLNFDFSAQVGKVEEEIKEINNNITGLNNKLQVKTELIADFNNQIKTVPIIDEEELKELKEKVKQGDQYKEKIKEYTIEKDKIINNIQELNDKELKLVKEQESVKRTLNDFENLLDQIRELSDQKTSTEIEKDNLEKEEAPLVKKIKDLEKEEKDLSEQFNFHALKKQERIETLNEIKKIQKLILQKKCPTCEQDTEKLGTDKLKKLTGSDNIKDQIDQAEKNLKTTIDQLEWVESDLKVKQKELKESESNHKLIVYKIDQLGKLIEEIDEKIENNCFKENKKKTQELAIECDYLENKISDCHSNKIDLEIRKKDLEDLIQKNSVFIEETNKSGLLIKSFEIKIREAEFIKANNDSLKQKVKDVEAEIVIIKENIKNFTDELNWKSPAINILKNDLPNYLIVKTGKILQDEINNSIKEVFPNYEVLLQNNKKGISFFYTNDKTLPEGSLNKWIDTQMSSGQERMSLTTSFKKALCKMYGIPMILLDEVEAAADQESSETLIRDIIQSGNFSQVFLISHKPELVDIISAEEDSVVYKVEKGVFTKN